MALAGQTFHGVPSVALIWVAVDTVAIWLLSRSAWGRQLCRTGANPVAARLSGTNTRRVRVIAYALSGGVAAFGGFVLTGYVGQAFLGLGNAYVLTSIVVAAICGVALVGGQVPYGGVACAAILMTVLVGLLTAINMGESGRQIIFGLTLLAFLMIDRRLAKR